MTKIKTNELTGAALDWAVAKALNQEKYITFDFDLTHPLIISGIQSWGPSFIWSQGGPIIEHHLVELVRCQSGSTGPVYWEAQAGFEDEPGHAITTGPTPLIAACRCFVTSRLGEEVDIPEELLT